MRTKLRILLIIVLGYVAPLNLLAATYPVTQTGSLGAGYLRQAVLDAEANPGPDIIEFAPALAGQTILLGHVGDSGNAFSALGINTEIEIRNTTGTNITIARDSASNYAMRVFNVRASGNLTLVNVTIDNGSLTFIGGANIASAGTFTAKGCTIKGGYVGYNLNPLTSGGGLLVTAGTATLINCTVTGNYSGGHAGGIACNSGASLNAFNCTVTGNTGGGTRDLVSSGTTVVRNTILGSNSFTPASGSSNNLAAALALPAALAANGGPTETMAIGVTSPAVGGGVYDPEVLTDQRGTLRPQFDAPDIGAYELSAFDTGQTIITAGGASWYLGVPVQGSDLSIYREATGQAPVNVGGYAVLIGQANDGTVIVKNSSRNVYSRTGSTSGIGSGWQHLTSALAGDGAAWFLGPDSSFGSLSIYRWATNGLPAFSNGAGTNLVVLTDGYILTQANNQSTWRRLGSSTGLGSAWQQVFLASTGSVLQNMIRLADGSFQFGFTNQTGRTFTVLTSTNLTAPMAQWTALGAPVESPDGTYQFTDSTATNNAQRYYRVTSP